MQSRRPISLLSYSVRLRLLLAPFALGIAVLVVLPALLSLGLAFVHYDGINPPRFAGLLNFRLLFTDELFPLSVANSLAFVLLPAPLRVAGAFLLARLLLRGGRGLNTLRTLVFLPSVIPSAAYALAWLWILNPLYGPLNLLLQEIGVGTPPWLVTGEWAKPGVALVLLWQLGEGFLVSLAALHDIPPQLEDAAQIDGAAPRHVLRYIMLPLVGPVLVLLLLRDVIILLQESLTVTWLTTQGGPYYATYTLPHFIYEQAFDLGLFGIAGAALWALYAITGVVVVLFYALVSEWAGDALDDQFLL